MAPTSPPSPSTSPFTLHRAYRQPLLLLIFLSLSATAVYGMWLIPQRWNLNDQILSIINSGTHLQGNYPLRRSFTGIKQLDHGISFLTVVFLPASDDFDPAFYLQTTHFLVQFLGVLGVWSVEGSRRRNAGVVISFTSIWALFYQTLGGAIVIPLYFIFYLLTSSRERYFHPSTREVPISAARTLLAALILGYVLPTFALLVPWSNKDDKQIATALWQFSPIFVNVIHAVIKEMDAFSHPRLPEKQFPPADYKYLQGVYMVGFVVCAILHIGVCGFCLLTKDSKLSLYEVFVPNIQRGDIGFVQSVHFIFQVDWWVMYAATGIWSVTAIWDFNLLRRSAIGVFAAVVAVTLGSVLVGPGATLSLVWSWREFKMIEIEQQTGKKEKKAQ